MAHAAPGASAPAVFSFHSTAVRTVDLDGQIWFVASDVAKALDYAEAKDLTRVLDEDEKGRQIVPTPSGAQDMIVINESGLYHALLKSRKPQAAPFRKWVTAEVLPAIRKAGRYEVAAPTEAQIEDAARAELVKPGRRFMAIFTPSGLATLVTIPQDAYIIEPRDFATVLRRTDGVPLNELPAIIEACAKRLKGAV